MHKTEEANDMGMRRRHRYRLRDWNAVRAELQSEEVLPDLLEERTDLS
jgi:hypothetical protein